jgi:hypothetical protein
MKITTKKIIDILVRDYYYDREYLTKNEYYIEVIKDTRNVINDILKYHKGINIKGK